MLEIITRALYYLGVHLFYASLVWVAAWVLTTFLRGSATAKYWICVATALNFMLPVGAVIDALGGAHLGWAAPLGLIGDLAARLTGGPAAPVVFAVWMVGAALMFARLGRRIRAESRRTPGLSGHDPRPGSAVVARGVPVSFTDGWRSPAVDGVLRPRISLPAGIERLLSAPELDAVLLHELTHARRRDNLIRLVHEVGLCLLWFHPLVWITGARLALFRELSCDESVIRSARGEDLLSALAKLAEPPDALVLQATASSFLHRRLVQLSADPSPRTSGRASAVLVGLFGGVLLVGVLSTVAHTACCFR